MPSALYLSPKDSIILVGPVIVAQCRRRENGPITHKDAYMEAWRLQQKQSGSEQRANDMCAQMAYECDPMKAFQTSVEKLARLQLYETWSKNVREANDGDLHVPGCLFPLASMREQGARIATTTLPPILSKSLRLQSVYMQSAHQWAMDPGHSSVLHVFGTASSHHGWAEGSSIPAHVSDVLTSFCKGKTIILVGYKDHSKDYVLMSFLKRCVQPHHSTNVVMLSTEAMSPLSSVSPVPVLPVVLDPGSPFETAMKGAPSKHMPMSHSDINYDSKYGTTREIPLLCPPSESWLGCRFTKKSCLNYKRMDIYDQKICSRNLTP